MATELTKPIERTIRIHGIDKAVILNIAPEGLSFRVKGKKKATALGWLAAIMASSTSRTVPSFLYGKPFEFLQHEAKERK